MSRGGNAGRGCAGEIELEPMIGRREDTPPPVHLAEKSLRNDFTRKVYGILLVQLLTTVVLAGVIFRHGKEWMRERPSLLLGAVTFSCGLSLAISLIFSCCPSTMRTTPQNYVLLTVFTLAESVLVGFGCLKYTAGSVLLCAAITALVVAGLTFYARQTKTDFTGFGPYLLCAMLVLFGTGLMLSMLASLGLMNHAAFSAIQIMYAAGGALVFSVFIVHDTQLILGGNHKHEFSVDDYIMAAICLYLDILQLFLDLLQLIGRQDDGGI